MQAGKLRHRLLIQRPKETQNADGQIVPSSLGPWEDVCEIWARVHELSGRELTAARQRQGQLTHEIEIRWRPGITDKMRGVMVPDGRVLNFLGPPRNPDGKKVALMIDAVEQPEGG